MARCMLLEAALPKELWSYAVKMAAYVRNRCYSKRIGCTPYQLYTGNKPNISNLHIFGSKCFAYKSEGSSKLEAKCEEGIFLGNDSESPAYLVYFPSLQKIKRERIVKFTTEAPRVAVQQMPQPDVLELPVPSPAQPAHPAHAEEERPDQPPLQELPPPQVQNESLPVRKSQRAVTRPKYLDYVAKADDHNFIHHCYRTEVGEVPNTYKQAIQSPSADKWRKAMDEEVQSLQDNKTYDLTPLPPGKSVVGGRWVYAIKPDGDGERYKARYVAQGYSQERGLDFDETFAPTAKMTSLRVFVQVAAKLDLKVHQLDVKTTYLNADIDKEVYVKQPDGYEQVDNDGNQLVCKLNKSLYGLKQSGRLWNRNIHNFFITQGFKQSQADHCIYTKHDGRNIIIILLWVDDIIDASSCEEMLSCFKRSMKTKYRMSDLGELRWFLGISFTRTVNSISMDQSKYIRKLLEKFQMNDASVVKTPCETCFNDTVNADSKELADPHLYCEIVGSLIYVMIATRPDLSFVVTKLSQYMSCPTKYHLNAARRVLRYLKGTIDQKLVFSQSKKPLVLSGFSDSDWGSSCDRKSVSGYSFQLSSQGPLVSWKSKKQSIVALSTCEAEYVALTCAFQEAIYLKQLVCDLTNVSDLDIKVGVDNQSAIKLSKNPISHQRSKHIDIKYHFIRHHVESGLVNVYYIESVNNVADLFTKAVSYPRLSSFVEVMFGY